MTRLGRLVPLLALAACNPRQPPELTPLPPASYGVGEAGLRQNGSAGAPNAAPPAQISLAPSANIALRQPGARSTGPGDVALNFADTDIREVVAQILGNILGKTYTIDPAVHGTATLRTAQPLSRDQLLPALQTLLAQNGATLVDSNGIYRVMPAAAAASAPGLAANGGSTTLVPLHFASADELAKVLQPFVQGGGHIAADAGGNALIVSGDEATRETLTSLIKAFDVDTLAGQSYALLPVTSGDAKDFATAMQDAVRGAGAALSNVVRVVPMARIDSVLVVSSQPQYIDQVRRIYGLVERKRRQTLRSWHVYYLQNSRSNDTAYVLQQAFTPDNVTATPTPNAVQQQGGLAFQGAGQTGAGGAAGGIGGTQIGASAGTQTGGLGSVGATPAAAPAAAQPAAGNPLLGGLEPSSNGGGASAAANANTMRIIPNAQNNAVLIYATPQENDTVEAMLRKLDILPLQVRIDATIAEVALTDNLQYGTQFFFKAGLQGALSFGASAAAFSSGFPGFVLSGPNGTSAALSLLQSVTKVKVLSSPQLTVLDNQAARLEVGQLVPYLSQTAQSTVTSSAPIVSSVSYQQTGVIMQVTPRVNSGGLVTLDISQEVSDVATGVTTPGVNSPTFDERSVSSRVVIQDGQTVGLAGLIQDQDSKQNQGIPWLKDIPLLGALASQQSNTRTRTELLVLITPHVVHDQSDARALTADLREELRGAALVPQDLNTLPQTGSSDPDGEVRRRLGLQRRSGAPFTAGD